MASPRTRRPASLLPALALGALASFLAGRVFLSTAAAPKTPMLRGRVAMHGFKEDFEAWRGALTKDERDLLLEQARGEYSKSFRKTDAFQKDLPTEKRSEFAKILNKFFENEVEDYKKETKVTKPPDYDGLLKKAGDVEFDWGLKLQIVEVDRMADRRYNFATYQSAEYKRMGKKYPQSSPLQERWMVVNNDTASHDAAVSIINHLKDFKNDPGCLEAIKPMIDEWVAKGVPPVGEPFEMNLPGQLVAQFRELLKYRREKLAEYAKTHTEAEVKKYDETEISGATAAAMKWAQDNYIMARDEIEGMAIQQRDWFRSQAARKDKGLTKADILKEIWAELPKHLDNPEVPPLDEEFLAEMAKVPAVEEGDFMHPWGTADMLYKSEAIDSFGDKYLLGVFETEAECVEAFEKWNAEYEKARAAMKIELQQWSKQERARLEKERGPGVENVEKLLKEARSR